MKWIVLDEKCGLIDETIKTYLNPLQVSSMKCIPDQGVSIYIKSDDTPYILPCSTSAGTKLIEEIIDFTTNKQNQKNVFDIAERISQLKKEDGKIRKKYKGGRF